MWKSLHHNMKKCSKLICDEQKAKFVHSTIVQKVDIDATYDHLFKI